MEPRWIERTEALKRLGLSEEEFKRLIQLGLIERHGSGNGMRFEAEQIDAVAKLWPQLLKLFPPPARKKKGKPQDGPA